MEIYKIAFALPYSLFQSYGTILIGSLLPVFLKKEENYLSVIRKHTLLFHLFILSLALISVKIQAKVFAPGFNDKELLLLEQNLYICWVLIIFSGLIFSYRLHLQSQDKKILVSSISLLFSLFFLILLSILSTTATNHNLAVISLISVFFVYLTFRFSIKNTEQIFKKTTSKKDDSLYITKILFGTLIYVTFLALPRLIDRAFASEMEIGVVANLDYAMNIYTALGIILGTSFSIIHAKKIAAEHSIREARKLWIVRLLAPPFLLTLIIASILYPFLKEIVNLTYVRGAFSIGQGMQVATILEWFVIALPFMVTGILLNQITAAYSILTMLMVICIKAGIKFLYISYTIDTYALLSFGQSTLLSESVGLIILLLFFLRRKIKKDNLC